jgi:tetratricopeptide (TPR) repeat protein
LQQHDKLVMQKHKESRHAVVSAKKPAARPATFFEHLKQALELIGDPAALGGRSPLATPYFLGEALNGVAATAHGRGLALCAALDRAAQALWGGPLPEDGQAMLSAALGEASLGGRYDCLILELNYFRQRYRPAPKNQAEIYLEILHISRPTHDRHLRGALERLGGALLQQIRPAIHLERPAPPPVLIGREPLLAQLSADLQAGRTVSLSGVGGVGKTALGAALAERWPASARFWYTFRPNLNDQLASLLFALGHFLHSQGASTLWHQLVAERGQLPDGALALGLALTDLAELKEPPLLCFDELDLLRPPAQDEARPGHAQVVAFLDGLRGHVPMLLIGQRVFWLSDTIYQLDELSSDDLAAWLTALAIPHTAVDLVRLHAYTLGNPRLAELSVALYRAGVGESFADALEQLPRSPALLPLWLRLERRLAPTERQLVQQLVVFRSPAPADVWQAEPEEWAALELLIERRLVQRDERGGVALLPALREVIYAELPIEQREELHIQAAHIRAERGAYTAAAYHLHCASQPEAAIELWYAQRAHEINQGQAGPALAIFAQISQRRLAPRPRKLLLLLRAELHELAGEPAQVVAELEQVAWPADDLDTPEALLRLGRAIEAQGQPALANQTYQAGLDAVGALLSQGAQLQVQRSLTSLRQREMQQAWQAANLARFHAETMLGVVHDQSGDYATAQAQYLGALAIAEQAGYQAGVAQTHHYLALLAGRQQDLAKALPHFEQAIAFYERVGDRVQREYVRSNLASAYIQARQFAAALEPAALALEFFERMGNSVRVAQNASNLAEAHAELGNLDDAEHYATLVLHQEEPQSHPYALYTLGTVHRLRGAWAQAERSYDQSRRIAEMNDDSYLLAFAWRALGEVARARGQRSEATHAFGQALALFQRLKLDAEVSETAQLAAQHDANPAKNEA